MKTILCYGDSNTFGFNPETGMRYPYEVRWPGKLQNLLGDEYRIIEEGCNGRTTVFDDPVEGWKNGISYLRPCLNSHKPIDMVILMLGSNDMKKLFHATAQDAANGAGKIVDIIKEFCKEKQGFIPSILLVSPPRITEKVLEGPFIRSFDKRAVQETGNFAAYYEEVARHKDCIFFDAARVVLPSNVDGLHLSAKGHGDLAQALFAVIEDQGIFDESQLPRIFAE